MILASTLTTNLAILVLAGFIGFVVISKVPNTLHTPLMSGTNAIHGIVLLGGLLIVGLSGNGAFNKVILVIAIAFGTINVVGGFLVTDRMLEMFKPKPKAGHQAKRGRSGRGEEAMSAPPLATSFLQDPSFLDVLYIIAFALFIQGLRGLSGPTTAVRGNRIAAVGMAIAVIATLLNRNEGNWGLIALGVAIGAAVGVPAARQVKMTAMPQMVALFNGVGGGAVFLISWSEFRLTHGYQGTATYIAIFSLFAAIVGSVSFWGSNIAFGKLQEIIPGRPISARLGAADRQPAAADPRRRGRRGHRRGRALGRALHRHARLRRAARQRRRVADRRRRHAGRDLAAERLHRPVRRRHGNRA